MKKTIYALIFLCLPAMSAMAQKGVHLGVQYGLRSIALIDDVKYGDVDYDYMFSLGSSYGVVAGININDYLGFQGEVNWARNGQRININEGGAVRERRIDLNYIQIPALVHISGGDFDKRFTADFGPQWGILTDAQIETENPKFGLDKVNSTSRFHSQDFGLVLDGGGEVNIVQGLYVSLNLRLYYGLTQINKDPNVVLEKPDENDKLSNAFGGLYAGLHYLLK